MQQDALAEVPAFAHAMIGAQSTASPVDRKKVVVYLLRFLPPPA
jgi:hypothetical protein